MPLPFAPYAPDQANTNPAVTNAVRNVFPTPGGYRPIKQMQALSAGLPAKCRGAIAVRTNADTIDIYAGTATRLYKYNSATGGWTEVTRLSAGVPVLYNLGEGDSWSFLQWTDKLIAVNVNDAPQVINIDSGTAFADLGGSPPRARYVFSSAGYIVLASTAAHPFRFYRSGVRQVDWWTVGKRGADYQDLDFGGWITGGTGNENGAYIFTQSAIFGMVDLPSDAALFSTSVIEPNRGAVGFKSIVRVGHEVYYVSEDGFYRLGAPSVPIGAERVDRTFLRLADPDHLHDVQGAWDPINSVIVWAFKSVQNTQDYYDKAFLYSPVTDSWSFMEQNCEAVLMAASPAVSIDAMDDLGFNADTIPYSLDSRVWAGGRPALAGFDSLHRFSFFEGEAMEARLETADLALSGDGVRTFVNGWRPVGDADGLFGQVAVKNTHGGTNVWSAEVAQDVTGMFPARASGRTVRFRLRVPAATIWSLMTGIEVQSRPEGRR